MKRLIFTLLVMCLAVMAHAQATSLTVDCQNPGWLSNLIKYGDQQTVENLKVTGYINPDDIKFINTMVANHSLRHLDIQGVTLVDESSEYSNYYGRMLIKNLTARLSYLALPTNIENVNTLGENKFFNADSIICNFNKVGILPVFGTSHDKKITADKYNHYIELGNNIDSLSCSRSNSYRTGQIYNITTSNMRFIGARRDLALNGEDIDSAIIIIKDFDKLEVLGYNSLFTTDLPDTIYLPSIEIFCQNAFRYHNGMHVYLGKNLSKINYFPQYVSYYGTYRDDTGEYNSDIVALNGAKLHLRSTTPPTIYHSFKGLQGDTIYIPKGTLNKYMSDSNWKSNVNNGYITLVEEARPLESIKLNQHQMILEIGETGILRATLTPEDSDTPNVNWSSSNPNVATVSDDGTVSAVSGGKTIIYAKSDNGLVSDSCKVTVNGTSTGISSIEGNSEDSTIEYYSIDGSRLAEPMKGVNIIKQKGRRTKKVIVK